MNLLFSRLVSFLAGSGFKGCFDIYLECRQVARGCQELNELKLDKDNSKMDPLPPKPTDTREDKRNYDSSLNHTSLTKKLEIFVRKREQFDRRR